jgi:hypothetical protein
MGSLESTLSFIDGTNTRFSRALAGISAKESYLLTPQMTAKMLNRQATKAGSEAEKEKAKVKKVSLLNYVTDVGDSAGDE